MGIPVVLGCTPDELAVQRECYGRELPFVHVTEGNFARTMEGLLCDEGMRRYFGVLGRRAVMRLHDVPQVVARLRALYEATEPARRLVTP